MKNSLTIFYVISFIFLFSCTKNKDFVNNSLIDEVLSLKDQNAQKLAFSQLLNSNEKSSLVHFKIKQMIEENSLTFKQERMLYSLKENIKPLLYESKLERDNFMKNFGKAWLDEASKIFDMKDIYKYLVNMSDVKINSTTTSDCNCNKGSSYSCLGRNECRSSSCSSSTYGCGFGWLWSCDGRCTLAVE